MADTETPAESATPATPAAPAKPAIPEVYVLWHPGFSEGEGLARRIYQWLRADGLGLQVFYRSLPAPGAPSGGLPPPLPRESRLGTGSAASTSPHETLQIVVLLIDAHLIADAAWRYWIEQLATSAPNDKRVIYPVALDRTAYNVPQALVNLNYLRPAGISRLGADTPWAPELREEVVRSLLKQLTEALCDRLLRPDGFDTSKSLESGRPKVTVFLSHAKADGLEPVRRLLEHIYSQTQLAAFFDENDIPFGDVFNQVLEVAMAGSGQAAAMLAVRSAKYADRPWCRRELAQFRQPRLVKGRTEVRECWQLNPVLVVDALADGAETTSIPEFGNVPVLRWSTAIAKQEELIVTTLLRSVLFGAYYALLSERMPDEPDCVVLNWRPDIATLMQIQKVRQNTPCRVYYPGRDFTGPELRYFKEFFSRVNFISFDWIAP